MSPDGPVCGSGRSWVLLCLCRVLQGMAVVTVCESLGAAGCVAGEDVFVGILS